MVAPACVEGREVDPVGVGDLDDAVVDLDLGERRRHATSLTAAATAAAGVSGVGRAGSTVTVTASDQPSSAYWLSSRCQRNSVVSETGTTVRATPSRSARTGFPTAAQAPPGVRDSSTSGSPVTRPEASVTRPVSSTSSPGATCCLAAASDVESCTPSKSKVEPRGADRVEVERPAVTAEAGHREAPAVAVLGGERGRSAAAGVVHGCAAGEVDEGPVVGEGGGRDVRPRPGGDRDGSATAPGRADGARAGDRHDPRDALAAAGRGDGEGRVERCQRVERSRGTGQRCQPPRGRGRASGGPAARRTARG